MLVREMAEAEDVDERMERNEQMAWMGAEDGDDSRQGRGGCARGNHGISEERNGSRGRGVPAALFDNNHCYEKTNKSSNHPLENRTIYDIIIMENGTRRLSDDCKKD